jgi:hypothetical protein
MPTQKSAPRRRRGQQQDEADLGDGRGWPMLRHQQALLAQLPGGEAAAAERRAQVLVNQGWGALQDWLDHPGHHPGERQQEGVRGAAADLATLFDEAA